MNIKRRFQVLTDWERWDYRVKYIPIYPVWLWYCLKARSWWFFTSSNPTLTFGGFEGESKREMYEQLPPSSYPVTMYVSPLLSFAEVEELIELQNITYPLAVKPDVGMMGLMFRKIDSAQALKRYHEKINVEYVVQELVVYPVEVSVFYYRFPYNTKGTITGFIKKELLEVVGDGSTILEHLIEQLSPRAGFNAEEWKIKHKRALTKVIPAGEVFRLSWAANLSRGSKLVSLAVQNDDRLLKVFDDLSNYTKHFYYGRFDIKCDSIESLKQGRDFTILEFNGSGAEPHHAYGAGNSLLQAHKIFVHHWKILYLISRYNHQQGIPYWPIKRGIIFLKAAKKHFKNLRKLDVGLED